MRSTSTTGLVEPGEHDRGRRWLGLACVALGQLMLALDATTYVGGHAPKPDTKATLQTRIDGYQATRDKINGLIKEGKSLAEIKTAMGDPEKNPSGCRGIPYLSLSEIEYNTQTNRRQEIK